MVSFPYVRFWLSSHSCKIFPVFPSLIPPISGIRTDGLRFGRLQFDSCIESLLTEYKCVNYYSYCCLYHYYYYHCYYCCNHYYNFNYVFTFYLFERKKKRKSCYIKFIIIYVLESSFQKELYMFWKISSKYLVLKFCYRMHFIYSRKFILENLFWKTHFKKYLLF